MSFPDPVQAQLSLAFQAFRSGRADEAAAACEAVLVRDPPNRKARELLGLAFSAQGRFSASAEIFEALSRLDPNHLAYRVNLGCAYLGDGRIDQAITALRQARVLDSGDFHAALNLGIAYYRAGDFQAAVGVLQLAQRLDAGDAFARVYLMRALLELGDHQAAWAAFEGLRGADRLDPDALNDLGLACAGLNEFEFAERYFKMALERHPGLGQVRINLAYVFERSNRLEEAARCLVEVPELLHGDAHYLLVSARLARRRGAHEDALAALDRALAGTDHPRVRSELLFERGKLNDLRDCPAEAIEDWHQANALVRDRTASLRDIGDLEAVLAEPIDVDGEAPPADWLSPDLPVAPVFLVGFPRSGTTLLDRVLDAHPDLHVMEEQPAIDALVRELERMPGGYPQALSSLTPEQCRSLREHYWQAAKQWADPAAGVRLVDKNPLNIRRIPLIARIFPDAPILLSLRHPFDVVLSCYIQNFRFTGASLGFWDLETTARLYDQFFSDWYRCAKKYPLSIQEVRYEHLVKDLESEARAVLKFLKVPWSEHVLDFHNAAAKRGPIHNPSYEQVVRPIYDSAVARWKRYEPHLALLKPILEPHCTRLGY